jgi:hypothetical protein
MNASGLRGFAQAAQDLSFLAHGQTPPSRRKRLRLTISRG